MREVVHELEGGAVELRAAATPYQHVRSIGEDVSAAELLLPGWPSPASGRCGRGRRGGGHGARRAAVVAVIPTGDEIRPLGSELRPGDLPDTNSLMLAAQAEGVGCRAVRAIVPDDSELIATAGGRRRPTPTS